MSHSISRIVFSKFFAWMLFAAFGSWFLLPNLFKKETSDRFALRNIPLGIDLQGGTYITLGVDIQQAIDNYLDMRSKTLRRVIREQTLPAPLEWEMKDHALLLTCAGDKDAQRLYNALHEQSHITALFSLTLASSIVRVRLTESEEQRIRSGAINQAVEVLQQRLTRKDLMLDAKVQPHGTRQIVVQLPHTDDVTYKRLKHIITQQAQLEFKVVRAIAPTQERLLDRYAGQLPSNKMVLPGKSREGVVREWYLVDRLADLDGEHITRAYATREQGDMYPQVNFRLDHEGDVLFQELTRMSVGKQLAIIIDDVVYSSPSIRSEIAGGNVKVEGRFSWAEANDLSHVLNSGSFQAPVKFEQEQRIGASLGQDSIRRGIISCLVGLGLVFVFSVMFYRLAGFLAMLALIYNLFLILLFLSVFRATLTLPGIIGMVLTIGMAVDASILIFEKIKEEIARGSSYRQALQDGFRGALVVIFDANFTTFGTGMVLYYLGGPSIQGFAITLMLGIVATFFSGVFFLRSIFEFLLQNTRLKRITF